MTRNDKISKMDPDLTTTSYLGLTRIVKLHIKQEKQTVVSYCDHHLPPHQTLMVQSTYNILSTMPIPLDNVYYDFFLFL